MQNTTASSIRIKQNTSWSMINLKFTRSRPWTCPLAFAIHPYSTGLTSQVWGYIRPVGALLLGIYWFTWCAPALLENRVPSLNSHSVTRCACTCVRTQCSVCVPYVHAYVSLFVSVSIAEWLSFLKHTCIFCAHAEHLSAFCFFFAAFFLHTNVMVEKGPTESSTRRKSWNWCDKDFKVVWEMLDSIYQYYDNYYYHFYFIIIFFLLH